MQELHVGGVNIVQSLPSEAAYREHNAPYFGETTGRVANRVSGAKINSLNGGKSYQLAANNGAHSLHGGVKGWGKVVFDGPHLKLNDKLGGKEAVVYKYFSKDGEEGYPGDIDFSVTYTAYTEEVKGKEVVVLDMDYEGELVGPDDVQETVINVTNHRYVSRFAFSSSHLCNHNPPLRAHRFTGRHSLKQEPLSAISISRVALRSKGRR